MLKISAKFYNGIILFAINLLLIESPLAQSQPVIGFNGASWGSSPEQVRTASGATNWLPVASTEFPEQMNVRIFVSNTTIATYQARVNYYFWNDQFFQATTSFDFQELKTYDFNYNVYRSVNEYYEVIRSKTIGFVYDIYQLLESKYGKKRPVFKGLDPLKIFTKTDSYLKVERWNLRYHPYDFYQRIETAAYARWDFPKTRILFSINISAADKRFDYILSAASLDMKKAIDTEIEQYRSRGL